MSRIEHAGAMMRVPAPTVSLGALGLVGGWCSAAVVSGCADVRVDVAPVLENVVRVRTCLTAIDDVNLLGFEMFDGSRAIGLAGPCVVLSHPNLDQESSGMPARRLTIGNEVVRGFDQAIAAEGGALVISCERPNRWVTTVSVSRGHRGVSVGVVQRDGTHRGAPRPIRVAAGTEVWSDPILVGSWGDPLEGLRSHSAMTGAACQALVPPFRPAPKGWNSWDHYGWMLNERIVRDEAAALPFDAGFCWVGFSGPWFDTFGDWRGHSERFPTGVSKLVDELHGRGLRVSLWLAPFLVEEDSTVFDAHPEWLARSHDGGLLTTAMAAPGAGIEQHTRRRCAVLDPTAPGVEDHLADLARRLTGELGADSLFVDFLRAVELPSERHDPGATGVEALRRGLGAMRAGLRDGAMLMAASGTVGLYPGLVHAGRIGPDISLPPLGHPVFSRWTPPGTDPEEGFLAAGFPPAAGRTVPSWRGVGGVWNEVIAMASRWHMCEAIQSNPDAALLGGTPAEARTVATLWSMTGGMLMYGDSLISLPSARRELLTRPFLREIHDEGRPARPTDLFRSFHTPPSTWTLDNTRMGDIVAITCWDDQPTRVEVPTARRHATELWTDTSLRSSRGHVIVTVAPHDTALVRMYD